MRRPLGRLTVLTVLVALGAGLSSLSLGPEFDNRAYYDGDGDDSGAVWKPAVPLPDVLAANVPPMPAPSIRARVEVTVGPVRLPRDVRSGRLSPRAPPPDSPAPS